MTKPSKPAHEIVLVTSDDIQLTRQCLDLRVKVFVDEQKFPIDTEIDEYDEPSVSVHFLLRLLPSLQPVGTVRLVVANGKVGRLCVLPDYRQYGFGRDLMVRCHGMAASHFGLQQMVLHAQIPVMPFYERLGYLSVGERFDEEGAPHQKMVMSLKSEPIA